MAAAEIQRQDFVVGFYRWAAEQWRLEIGRDLATLRSIRGVEMLRAIEMLEAFEPAERISVGMSLTKRFHPEAAELTGDGVTDVDRARWARCDELRRYPASGEETLRAAPLLPRRTVADALRGPLKFLGKPTTLAGSDWNFSTSSGSWRVATHVDLGRRDHSFSYSHEVSILGTPPIKLVSIASWMGLGSSTKWRVTTDQEAVEAAGVLAELCRLLIDTVDNLTSR